MQRRGYARKQGALPTSVIEGTALPREKIAPVHDAPPPAVAFGSFLIICKVFAHLRQSAPELRGLLHGCAVAPFEEMPAHFVEAAGFECDHYRLIADLLNGLVRVKEEDGGVVAGARPLKVDRQFDNVTHAFMAYLDRPCLQHRYIFMMAPMAFPTRSAAALMSRSAR